MSSKLADRWHSGSWTSLNALPISWSRIQASVHQPRTAAVYFRCASFHTPSCTGASRLAFELSSFAISTESQATAVRGDNNAMRAVRTRNLVTVRTLKGLLQAGAADAGRVHAAHARRFAAFRQDDPRTPHQRRLNRHGQLGARQVVQRANARCTASTNIFGWSAWTQWAAPSMTSTAMCGNIGANSAASPLGT